MRDYTKFKPGFWTGDFGDEIRGDPWSQALASYLITCPHGNMIGLYRLPMSYIIEDLGWSAKEARKALSRLERAGFCVYDQKHRAVWVRELARHEWGDEPNMKDLRVRSLSRTAPKILDSLHRSPLTEAFFKRYREGWKDVLQGLRKPLASPCEVDLEALPKQESESESESESEQESELESELEKEKADISPAKAKATEAIAEVFEHYLSRKLRWYDILGLKVPRKTTLTASGRKAIRNALENGHTVPDLIEALDHVENDSWLMGKVESSPAAKLSLDTLMLIRTTGRTPLDRVAQLKDKTRPDPAMSPLIQKVDNRVDIMAPYRESLETTDTGDDAGRFSDA